MRPEGEVELADVRCQVLQRRRSEYGAVVAQVGGLSAVQVDLGVVCRRAAGQFGAQLLQLPVGSVDELRTVVGLEPHRGVGAGVGAHGPGLIVDSSLVVELHPLSHVVKLTPYGEKDVYVPLS